MVIVYLDVIVIVNEYSFLLGISAMSMTIQYAKEGKEVKEFKNKE